MQHFPIFLSVRHRHIVLSGGGEAALAKLRLLLKTKARITVFASNPARDIEIWTRDNRLSLVRRALEVGDVNGAVLFYAADEDETEDARTAAIAKSEGALVNVVDNLSESEFITPAIVDRDPVVVAIGTEGAAPVLARAIKADLEARLSPSLGILARIGKAFRPTAESLPAGRARRDFWSKFYFGRGPKAIEQDGVAGAETALKTLLSEHSARPASSGHIEFVGAGPGDPELLTLKARKSLDKADVVIHDRLVTDAILELARREAIMIDAGKTGFGPGMAQKKINALIVKYALQGHHVVRLKSGDPTVFGRLDEEIDAADAAGVEWRVIPGITAASSAVATIGQSLTKRGRNGAVRFLTGHDMKGFAEHDWAAISRRGEVSAIYMGKKSARFVQGRMLMHGAKGDTPVSVIENASQIDQRILSTTVADMAQDIADAELSGAALTFIGLSPRTAMVAAEEIQQEELAL